MAYLPLIAIGLVAGVLAGMFGIGGGLVIVPALLFAMKMGEVDAIGTSLAALIPPVGLMGALEYRRSGHVNLKYALVIAAGLFLGSYFGAKIILALPPLTIRRIYALFLVVAAVKMLLASK